MKRPYTAIDIASFFINKGVTPLQLQKLLYYSQLWFFVKSGKYLFANSIKAWIYGPVIHSVWDNFRYMKRSSVIPLVRAKNVDLSDISGHLDNIWKAYGHLSGSQLVDLSHSELPWKTSRVGLLDDTPSDKVVSIDKATTKDFKLDYNNQIPIIQNKLSLGAYSNT